VSRRAFLEHASRLTLAAGGAAPALAALATELSAQPVPRGAEKISLESRAAINGNDLTLGNDAISATWVAAENALRPAQFTDRLNAVALPVPTHLFSLTLADRSTMSASDLRLVGAPQTETLASNPGAARLAERSAGHAMVATLRDPAGRLEAEWRAILRDGSSYIRQEVTLRALAAELPVREIALVDFQAPSASVPGLVRGTPIIVRNAYVAFEHPLANNAVDGERVRGRMSRTLPLRPGSAVTVSSVVGVTRPGQMRRDFLAYVERERAHPYRTFLHYNSWYDLGYFSKYDETGALAVINAFGQELHQRRGVTLDSFLFDDGWDDSNTLWHFNAGFPDGFTKVREAAARYGAAPGVWMSPWGGYGKPKADRIAAGKAQGFETNADGFALSGPVYYKRFRDTCLDMIRRYGVNQFKFDGTGDSSSTFPDSPFDSDFDAAIHLIGELRAEKPDLYVNLTTGTYPSPFWLRYADSIWRGGDDHDFTGVGSSREKWITYRDSDTYDHVVRSGALFPISSLMLHGMIYAKSAHNLMTDPGGDFTNEVRSYFGTGTQLQEMYITPALLSAANWDTIAECARWSRTNAATLSDTHWIGGDPQRMEPYGWASWSRHQGIITLRNPADRPRRIAIDVSDAFELPADAPRMYIGGSPWASDHARPPLTFRAGDAHAITLAPFEVATFHLAAFEVGVVGRRPR